MVNSKLIDGIKVSSLNQFKDERGAVFHILKESDKHFRRFGEAYISKVNSNVIKGWKYHKEMHQNFSVPFGEIKLVVVDGRKESSTYNLVNEFILSPEKNYKLISIPPKLWYGFKCISDSFSLLLNISDMVHDPNESLTQDLNDNKIKYKWE
tara:strand:+ start:10177 stop:10632 length:456 start_codon:yes stop_codon:yes gene_type:complete